MIHYPYDVGPIRPPSEANSLLIRVNRNCPWNKCEFCPVYKNSKFEKKTLEEVINDIISAANFYGAYANSIETIFLQDANPLLMKTEELLEVLRQIKKRFKNTHRITAYARSSTLARKSIEELKTLKDAGLSRIHTGLETGFAPLLEYVKKGASVEQMIEGGRKVIEAGIELSEYVMPGLGGKKMSIDHAIASAQVLNQINPHFIRLRSFIPIPNTPLYRKINSGEFKVLSQVEIVQEIKIFISNLVNINSYIVSDHAANLLYEVEGKLPTEKDRIIDLIDKFLLLSNEEQENFIVGKRLGIYNLLYDLSNKDKYLQVEEIVKKIRLSLPSSKEPIEEGLKGILEQII